MRVRNFSLQPVNFSILVNILLRSEVFLSLSSHVKLIEVRQREKVDLRYFSFKIFQHRLSRTDLNNTVILFKYYNSILFRSVLSRQTRQQNR